MIHFAHGKGLWFIVHLVCMGFSKRQSLAWSVGVKKELIVDCQEISVFFGRHHSDVFDILSDGDESRFVFFKIEVNEDEVA